jgi:hypothetical protein
MKRTTSGILILIFYFLLSNQAFAQQKVAVPLSHPGKSGKLSLSLVRGSITVSSYDGKNVLINYNGNKSGDKPHKVTKNGLHKISGNSGGFQAEEDNNHVTISGISPMHVVNLNISVPRNFSLDLSAVKGNIKVNNISGVLDVHSVDGDLTLTNVAGAATANTVNGDITANFKSVSADMPMSFSTINGDIDVKLPANSKISAKMKAQFGDIYTDFDMNINRKDSKKVKFDDSGTYKVSVNNWIKGEINGGGPEYQFKTLRGDIYIRKRQ